MLQPGHRWIPLHENRYAVTAHGAVWSYVQSGHPRRLALRGAHPHVTLCRDGQQTQPYVADLVLAVWGPTRKPGQVILHRDGNPANNRLTNLRWVSEAERTLARQRHGQYAHKISDDDARRIYRSRRTVAELAGEYGVNRSTIERIRNHTTHRTATRKLHLAARSRRLRTAS